MGSALFETLVEAIRRRKLVLCAYQGFPRVCCPHSIGWTQGVERLLTYQFAGDSSQGLPAHGEWWCFDIHAKCNNIRGRMAYWPTAFTAEKVRSTHLPRPTDLPLP
jgi:hypothetical protein